MHEIARTLKIGLLACLHLRFDLFFSVCVCPFGRLLVCVQIHVRFLRVNVCAHMSGRERECVCVCVCVLHERERSQPERLASLPYQYSTSRVPEWANQ